MRKHLLASSKGNLTWPNGIVGSSFIAVGSAPAVGTNQIAIGGHTIPAASGTCPTGKIGGQTVQGCVVMNVAGTARNVPHF